MGTRQARDPEGAGSGRVVALSLDRTSPMRLLLPPLESFYASGRRGGCSCVSGVPSQPTDQLQGFSALRGPYNLPRNSDNTTVEWLHPWPLESGGT